MSTLLTGRTIRIAFNQSSPDTLTDKLSGAIPKIAKRNALRIQGALFLANPDAAVNLVTDLSQVASVSMVCRKTDAAGTTLFTRTIAVADFDAALTFDQWLGLVSQHFVFEITGTDTNQTFESGKTTMSVYFAFEAEIVDSDPVFLGSFTTDIFEPGIGNAGTPTPGDPTYSTTAEADARYAPQTVAGKARFTSAGGIELWSPGDGAWVPLTLTGTGDARQLIH